MAITIYLLLLLSLGYAATDIYLPSLPPITAYFHISENEAQMTLSSYLISFSLTPLLFGPLSDRMGRKKIILIGLTISFVATFGCLGSSSISHLIGFRFLQGIGAGAVLISARAIGSDLFSGKALARQISLTTMLMPLILAVAPTLGGVLQEYFGWQSVFAFLLIYIAFLFLMVLQAEESLKITSKAPANQIFSIYKSHLCNRVFTHYAINSILPCIGLFAYLTISPFLFQEKIGLSPAEYGSLSLYSGAVIMLTGLINLKLIKFFNQSWLIGCGSIFTILAGALLLGFQQFGDLSKWTLLFPSLCFFTCVPLCLANAASKAMNSVKHHFGAAVALLTTLQYLAGSLSSFIFSLIPNETATPLGLCFILIGSLSLGNIFYIKYNNRAEG